MFAATVTFCAVFGPRLLTLMVKLTALPLGTGFGEAEAVTLRSEVVPRNTDTLPSEVQVPVATLTPMVIGLVTPALKVICGVPCPAVMAPPVMDQLYVVPFGPAGTEATLPVELTSTVAGAVILTVPVLEETVTLTGADVAVQPFASTTLTE